MSAKFRSVLALALLLLAPLCTRAQQPAPAPTTVTTPPIHPVTPPSPSSSVPSVAYTVSPGDVLDINFRWTPEFNQTVTVQPDGNAAINAAGEQVHLAGLTVEQVHDVLVYKSSARLVNPEITVTLHDVDRPHVLVGGEVTTPGRIDLRRSTTAFEAIFMAGGAKDSASMSHVVVFRRVNSEYSEVIKLNFRNYDSGRKPKQDLILQPGDMILVPRDGLTKLGRYIKTLNIGAFFNVNPLGANGLF